MLGKIGVAIVSKKVKKGFNPSSRFLTYDGLKYISEIKEGDLLYSYDIVDGFSGYTKVEDIKVVKDGFYNLTELRLSNTNSVITSPTNPIVVSLKEGLKFSRSCGVVKGTNTLVCIANDIKELNLNVGMYLDGVISGALDIEVDSAINIKSSDVVTLSKSLKEKELRFRVRKDGYISLLEPIMEVCRGNILSGMYTKCINARLSYLLGVIDCITVEKLPNGRLKMKHTDGEFLLGVSNLMLTVGILPMHMSFDGEYYELEYVVTVNIRKLYKSSWFEDLEVSVEILSERRLVKNGGGTVGMRLYFRSLELNPLKLSYDYYDNIIELVSESSKYFIVSTLGVPMML